MVSPPRGLPGPRALGDTYTGSLFRDPTPCQGMPSLRWAWLAPDAQDGCLRERRPPGLHPNVSLCLSPPHPPSQPWHSNQCPLTSHLAISVNQLKLARCHKNIYTFDAIGKFKSSSCALLPRKLHSSWGQSWARAAGAAQSGPLLPTHHLFRVSLGPHDLGLELCWTPTHPHTHHCHHSMTYTILGGGREGEEKNPGYIKKSSQIASLGVRISL